MTRVIEGVRCLSTAEAMDELSCGRTKLFRLRDQGVLTASRVGNRTYWAATRVKAHKAGEAQRIKAELAGAGQ